MQLYNTLTKKKEELVPIKKGYIGMYSCGPTVYSYQHIGNFRTALLTDLLKRVLIYNGLNVKHVVNFTDVDDKIIRAMAREKLSLKALTSKYESIYLQDLDSLNIVKPTKFLRATESIDEMVKIIKGLLKDGYAYTTNDGVYFSISKFKNYGKMAGIGKVKNVKERIRNDEYAKSDARDFALWKFYSNDDGDVYWDTPFGKGRPGWHIECSAMSMSELGPNFDIHLGGNDLLFPHHTNEIAQSEAYSGKKFVNYWVHGGMLNLKEGKMSKSLGNLYTITDLRKEGFDPLHYRYLCLQTHYRKPLEFSFESLTASKNAYEKIQRKVYDLLSFDFKGEDLSAKYSKEFLESINDDLNLPRALEVFWRALEDNNFDSILKIKLIKQFDSVLGLDIKFKIIKEDMPKEVIDLAKKRDEARKMKDWKMSDKLREDILKLGYIIEDGASGHKLSKK